MALSIDNSNSSAAAQAFYQSYLNSSDWRVRRNRALHRARWVCSKCSSTRDLEVHHKTYERLGREWDQDLEVLCRQCHGDRHVEAAVKSETIGVYVKLARAVFRCDGYLSIADLSADIKVACISHRVPVDHEKIAKALAIVTGNYKEIRAQQQSGQRQAPAVPQPENGYAPPCGCRQCVAADVAHLRLRMDPRTREWLHGDDLRRWYEARARFKNLARTAVGERGRHATGFEPLVLDDADDEARPR